MLSTDLNKNHQCWPTAASSVRPRNLSFARSRFSHKDSKEEKIDTMVGAAAVVVAAGKPWASKPEEI